MFRQHEIFLPAVRHLLTHMSELMGSVSAHRPATCTLTDMTHKRHFNAYNFLPGPGVNVTVCFQRTFFPLTLLTAGRRVLIFPSVRQRFTQPTSRSLLCLVDTCTGVLCFKAPAVLSLIIHSLWKVFFFFFNEIPEQQKQMSAFQDLFPHLFNLVNHSFEDVSCLMLQG